MTDLSPRTRALLDQARAGLSPGPTDPDRLHPKVMAAIAAGSSPPDATPPGGTTAISGSLATIIAGTTLLAILLGSVVLLTRTPTRTFTAISLPAPPAPAVDLPPRPPPLPPSPSPSPSPSLSPPVSPSLSPPSPVPRRPAPPTPALPPPGGGSAEPPPVAAEPTPPPNALAQELALVAAANRALQRGDAATALATAERHNVEHPDGQLAEEAAVVRIEALCRLHRQAETDAARRTFRSRWPRSAQRDRVEAACPHEGAAP